MKAQLKSYYAVFADCRFFGLYRSKAAARRLIEELNLLGYYQAIIKEVYDGFTEEEFLSYGWGARAAYWICLNAIEHNYFGRIRIT